MLETIVAYSVFLSRASVSLIKLQVQVSYANMPLKQLASCVQQYNLPFAAGNKLKLLVKV